MTKIKILDFIKKYYKATIFALFSILFLNIAGNNIPPRITGDGIEYYLMNQAFSNHLTPDIRLQDVEVCIERFEKKKSNEYYIQILNSIKKFMQIQNIQPLKSSWGIFRSYKNKNYSYHFWFYSAICTPVTWILRLLNADELRTFQLTNTLIILLVIYYLVFLSGLSVFKKTVAISFFFTFGILYYLTWTHPEVFSASCFFISLLLLKNKKYYLSVFLTMLASLQNPPIAFFIPFIILVYIKNEGFKIKQLLLLGFISSFTLFPTFFYYYHFKVTNIILATTNMVSKEFLTLKRLSSLFFDINQGIIVAMPLIILFFIYTIIRDTLKKDNRNIYIFYLLLIIAMAIPSIQQRNWNMGASVIVRYGLWISVPVIIYLITQVDYKKFYLKVIAMVIIISQIYICNLNGWHNPANWKYVHFNKLTIWVFDHCPGIYNPDPEIFAERIKHKEDVYPSESPFIYYTKDNKVKKVLVHKNYIQNINESAIKDIVNIEELSDKKTYKGWIYLNY